MRAEPVDRARAFWTIGAGRGELREEPLPAPREGERRVRMLASGISRGTEAIVFAGRVPASQHAAMRAPLMAGDFPFPVKYGYAAVGALEGGGPDDGGRVFVLHPHQDVFNAPAAMCIPLPAALPTARAVLGANMETALNIFWDAAPLAGERMMVIGAGVVGLLAAALLARVPGGGVTVVDIDPARRRLAEQFGCRFALPPEAPGEQELIVHASGSAEGLALALQRAAFECRIVEASWFADAAPAIALGEAFHARRLRLVASQVGAVAPAMRGRRSHAERLALALALLDNPAYDALLEAPTPFAALPGRMAHLLAGGLCHWISYGTQ
ncbi:MAG: dehydrogenase [Rhodospirillales bacterium]|nr:dehydrogenase [Rhodospirillales bacterium]MDE2577045.1 dehydrogenase [Rhodospirillales bacterium]